MVPATAVASPSGSPSVRPLAGKALHLGARAFVADPSGALYWPDADMLIVADLHLEKGSAYAARGVFLPPYDTGTTLARLADAVTRLNPRRILALGDSFHDAGGADRLQARDRDTLGQLHAGREMIWIAGNHDPAPHRLGGTCLTELTIGDIVFRHEPRPGETRLEITGHLHPVAIVGGRGGALRRRCFLSGGNRCILPAFGAYAGGLNIHDDAFADLFEGLAFAHVLGRAAVYTVGRHQCLAEARGGLPAWRF